MRILAGIFIGGKGTRMGGVAKGLLPAPDGAATLIDRTAALIADSVPDAAIVLVGEHPEYRSHPLRRIADQPAGIGPLGGLIALLDGAVRSDRTALAIACDLPYLTTPLITRMVSEQPEATVLAPHLEGWWQPLFARYEPNAALDAARRVHAAGRRSLQAVLKELGGEVRTFELASEHRDLLDDWDTQADVDKSREKG